MDNAKEDLIFKNYSPLEIEKKWQRIWADLQAFHGDPDMEGDPFCIVIPPPNVTGSLHMGHAFNTALIDVIVRFNRLSGKNVLCLPGTDHASIAVQTILEKQIKKEGLNKDDIGRNGFMQRAWDWKDQSGGKIVGQLKSMGYSVDWQRERFTLDEELNKSVVEAFILLHKRNLIYRGEYLVNWCPASQSAVSDLEVEMQEVNGYLWHFKYPIIRDKDSSLNESSFLEVATTRPETLLGDTAVAVNPNDSRYKKYIGKKLKVPFVEREIPVIGDLHVDMEFGTGCVKVTPAHDPNDFQIGKRHNLEQINIMNKDGTLNSNAGKFVHLDRFDARKKIVQELEEIGLLTKIENYKHTIPFSDRGKVPIEPLLSTQWFLKMEQISSQCLSKLDDEKPNFVPSRWAKVYRDWLLNINDWCLSRQLWWGHQIPAWYILKNSEVSIKGDTPYVIAHDEEEALQKAQKEFGLDIKLIRDKDVLDTWFSSGLWPFSSLGWPNMESKDLQRWYPNSVLVTGFDIIFFWVARMTMLGNALTAKIPFNDVYIHGLVRDENNKKMSKSSGNGIDPLLLINKYGSDALRFALIREVAGAGQDIRLDYDRKAQTSSTVEASRNFANKIWNATKFALINCSQDSEVLNITYLKDDMELSDRWILSKVNKTKKKLYEFLRNYKLGEAAKLLYEFVWNDFCDWYVEFSKIRFNSSTKRNQTIPKRLLIDVLNDVFIMMNPFMPHISEELWHALNGFSEDKLLSLQKWPSVSEIFLDNALEQSFSEFFAIVRLIRNLRAELGLKPSQKIPIYLISSNNQLLNFIEALDEDIKILTKSSEVNFIKNKQINEKIVAKSFSGIIGDLEVYLPFEGVINIDSLRDKLNKDLYKVNKEIETFNKRISNKNFVNKAPKEIVQDCMLKLNEAQSKLEAINKKLSIID
tara:strand:- start:2730 stop:5492 length:2763 start_codon:yes stop_codon:yes gene_type:complete